MTIESAESATIEELCLEQENSAILLLVQN